VRVVSLVPSSTETLLALGADVVACTRFCEQPGLPHVGGTKNPDVEAIVALRPDVVVLDAQENRREDAEELRRRGLETFVSDVRDVSGALDVVRDLAALVGDSRRSGSDALPRAAGIVPGRTAFVPIWRRPWMTIGPRTYGASVLRHLGWRPVGSDGGADYPTIELDAVARASPDAVLVPSEPYDFEARHLAQLRAALPSVPVIRVDGRDLFWWGVRTPGALVRLGARLAALAS
jgi:ABC-type Fe3+-hydroxamate transport system substrate-binding protein